MYFNHIVGFRDIDSNAISLKYSIYIFAIAKPSSCRYMCDPIPKCVVCVQKVNISIRLSIGILICSYRDESEANLSLTTESASSMGTLVNKLTTSKLTIWLDRMGAYLIIGMSFGHMKVSF